MLILYYSLYANTNVSLTGSRIIRNINARVPRILYKYVVGDLKVLESIKTETVNSNANRIFTHILCANRILFFIYEKNLNKTYKGKKKLKKY
jgi:hypothetical protein